MHGLDSQKLLKCLDVVLNDESIDFDIIQHDKSAAVDYLNQFMGSKAKVRSGQNPTVRKAMASENRLGWIEAIKKEWDTIRSHSVKEFDDLTSIPVAERQLFDRHGNSLKS